MRYSFLLMVLVSPALGQESPSLFEWPGFTRASDHEPLFYFHKFISGTRLAPESVLAKRPPGRIFVPEFFKFPVGENIGSRITGPLLVGVTDADEIRAGNASLEKIDVPWAKMYLLQTPMAGGNGFRSVFYFDAETNLLIDYHGSFWICGFCPHIQVRRGDWRLQGKLLAGCIGKERRGDDAMVLRSIERVDDAVDVRISNWAPEIEYLDSVALAFVPVGEGESVELDRERRPWTVKNARLTMPEPKRSPKSDTWRMAIPESANAVVIEMRNSGDFESEMRKAVLNQLSWPKADLSVAFDSGEMQTLPPVGTKFPRRIVIPLPERSKLITLTGSSARWHIRRVWFCNAAPTPNVTWISMKELPPLRPMEQIDLKVAVPAKLRGTVAVVLRMSGYYEFESPTEEIAAKLRQIEVSGGLK